MFPKTWGLIVLILAASLVSAADAAKPYDKASKGGVKGVISFEGEAPKQGAIDTGGDIYCHKHHEDTPLKSETVVVNDGKVQNAVIFISSGAERFKDYPVPTEAATLDQVGCRYVPHVLAVQLGQKVQVRNGDSSKHNVHLTGDAGDLNLSQDAKGQVDVIPEAKLATGFTHIGCDIHKWMSAKLAIFDHPFFAVSNEKGEFEIKGLPDGDYELTVWHESADKRLAKLEPVKIKIAGDTITQNFTFKKKQ
jgi:plastocyanin